MTKKLNKQFGKLLSLILSVAMLVTGLPVDTQGGIVKAADGGTAAEVYTFDFAEQFPEGASVAAVTDSAATTTIASSEDVTVTATVYSKKSAALSIEKKDTAKTFEDNYASAIRFAPGGKSDVAASGVYALIAYETKADNAKVKIWWAAGDADRQMYAIPASTSGTEVKTDLTTVKNSAYISTLTLDKAGIWYIGSKDGANWIYKFQIYYGDEEPAVDTNDGGDETGDGGDETNDGGDSTGDGGDGTEQVATPVASPKAGTYTKNQSVTLTSTTAGATIYYTVDGTEPTTASTQYTGAIAVDGKEGETVKTTIKAIAVLDGKTNSEVATFDYEIKLPKADAGISKTYVLDVTTLESATDKEAVTSGTKLGTEGYFKALSLGSYEDKGVTKEGTILKRGTTGAMKALEIDKKSTAGVRFTVEGKADVTLSVCSTGKTNISSVALVDGSGNIVKATSYDLAMENEEGTKTDKATELENGSFLVYGNQKTPSTLTYEGLAAGTYTVLSPENADANRAMWLVGATVTDTVSMSVKVDTYVLDVTTLESATDKEEIASGTKLGTDGYFKALSLGSYEDKGATHEGTILKRGTTGAMKALEIDKKSAAGVRFTVEGTADVVLSVCSTGKTNISSVALVDGSGNIVKATSYNLAMENEEGTKTDKAKELENGSFLVYGNQKTPSTLTYEGLAAGTYTILSPENSDANRAMWLVGATVTDTKAAGVTTEDYVLDATTLESATDKEEIPSGTKLGTNDYFKALSLGSYEDKGATHEGTILKRGTTGAMKALEIDKKSAAGIRFTVQGTADAVISVCSTGKTNISSVALVDDNGNIVKATSYELAMENEEGTKTDKAKELENGSFLVYGNQKTPSILTYKGLAAGNYTILSPENSDANRAMWLVKAEVSDTFATGGGKQRKAWSDVDTPVIASAKQEDLSKTGITVKVNAVIGNNGADTVKIGMYQLVGEEYVLVEEKIEAGDADGSFTKVFDATASGDYYFKATATRDGEADKVGEMSAACKFVLPLTTPSFKNATNRGGGKVLMGWNPVKEAVSYKISYKENVDGAVQSEAVEVTAEKDEDSSDDWAYTLNLEVDKTYTVYIQAIRGEDASSVGSMEVKVLDRIERVWEFAAFGASTSISATDINNPSKSKNGYLGNAEDGSVQVWSTGGAGKIVPLSTDGIAFYYTKLDPIKDNFVLKAKLHVDSWTISNGQDGFGLLVTDRVGANGDTTDPFWNNSYMAAVTKIEYRWNKEAGELTTDSEVAANTSMKLGIGTIARTGVPAGWSSSTLSPNFSSTMTTLEYSCGKAYGSGTFNIIGNCTNPSALVGNQDNQQIVDINFSLERSNTGYRITYYDADWNVLETKMYYDEKYFEDGKYTGTYKAPGANGTLMQMDPNGMYVGFFAARNATVTFSDISLTVTEAAKDAPAEERIRDLIDPSYSIASSSNANSADYDLQFFSNVPGYVTITRKDGSYVANNYRIDAENTKLHFPVTLDYGKNVFNWTMTPDKDYEIGGEGTNTFLKDYNVRSDTFEVTYNTFGNKYIYVTPDATAKGKGTEDDPVDIATAIKYISAGQTILLGGGTYKLTSSLTISRGINGTASDPIRMIANPSAKERPVIDFGKTYKTGMKLAGNYWILQGFDVTNSGDGTDGLQVCGNHNVLDSLNTYKNGNTGIQISRLNGTDTTQKDWPSYNTVKNCTSYLNADGGYEDADGFAAKLTVGPGNVFDGCIAAYNADDGWDLFAKVETGPIGKVTIKNSVAYGNGWVFDEAGNKIDAGNGNGFKMGGSSITGYHTLINSIAFDNKAKGIDSNSCPDIQVQNCITFNNKSYNIAMYTGNGVPTTDYSATGVISYRTDYLTQKEQLNQKIDSTIVEDERVQNDTNYFWDADTQTSKNKSGATVSADWFESLEFPTFENGGAIVNSLRNSDGTVNLGSFLKLTDKATAGVGAKNLDTEGSKSEIITAEKLQEEKKALLEEGLKINAISDQVYTGKAIKPSIRVTSGLEYLTTKDYSVKYVNNVKVGTASIVITGKGNYAGKIEATFKITPKDISDDDVTLKNEQIAVVGNGKNKAANVVVMWGKKKLAKSDYTLTYYAESDPSKSLGSTGVSANGRYIVTIKGTGNFTGEKEAEFVLTDKDHLMTSAKVTFAKTTKATGLEVEADKLAVSLKGKTLKEGEDYEVDYVDNVNPGRATGIVRGLGDYAGEKLFYFRIVGESIKRATVKGMPTAAIEYPGEAATLEGLTLTLGGKQLTTGTDFTVSYKNNNKVGTAQILFTGTGMYEGVLVKTFKITAHSIADEYEAASTSDGKDKAAKGHIIVEGLETNYQKGGAKLPDLTIKYYDDESKKTFYLKEKKDYTVTYKNNNKISTGKNASYDPYIVIKGTGAYRGTLQKFITINPQELDATEVINGVETTIAMIAPDVTSTKGNAWKTKLTVTDLNGKKLVGTGSKADYVVKYLDESGKELTSAPAAGSDITVQITAGPSGYYVGSNETVYRVIDKAKDIKKAKVVQSKTDLIYFTGEGITLEDLYSDNPSKFPITVTLGGQTLKFGEDYEVVPGTYKNNVKRGTAKVTIRGIGDKGYGGQKVITFKIAAKALQNAKTVGTNDGTDDGKDGTKDGKDVK